jgi:hypothetical protein
MAFGSEVVRALDRCECVDGGGDSGPEYIAGAGGGFAEERLGLREGVLDRVEVRL